MGVPLFSRAPWLIIALSLWLAPGSQADPADSRAEGWYRTLADDAAQPEAWREAAGNIVCPADEDFQDPDRQYDNRLFFPPRFFLAKIIRSGESLRSKTAPSVTELLGRRMRTMAARTDDVWLKNAGNLALCESKWDPVGSREDVRWLARQWMACDRKEREYLDESRIDWVTTLTDCLLPTGDKVAAQEFVDWVATLEPARLPEFPELFVPFWKYRNQPELAAGAERIFNDPGSPWSRLVFPIGVGGRAVLAESLSTPLLSVPGFRKLVLRELGNTAPLCPVEVTEPPGDLVMHWSDSYRVVLPSRDPRRPAPGEYPVRVCDYVASKIAGITGAPEFQLYWPAAARDAGVRACSEFLERFGDELLLFSGMPSAYNSVAIVTFPQLDRPARAEDVESGRAIFSLAGKRHVRRLPLAHYPMDARWKNLYSSPTAQAVSGKEGVITEYGFDQTGFVWQAEEWEEDGKWNRVYGFVGDNVMAQVPADEIEFPSAAAWDDLKGAVDAQIVAPGAVKNGETRPRLLSHDAPLTAVMWLRNGSGLDQIVASPAGEIRLLWGPAPSVPNQFYEPGAQDWVKLAPRGLSKLPPLRSGHALPPAGEWRAREFDLHEFYSGLRPGYYRLEIALDGITFPDGSPRSCDSYFQLK
jgi:hypothetical protein